MAAEGGLRQADYQLDRRRPRAGRPRCLVAPGRAPNFITTAIIWPAPRRADLVRCGATGQSRRPRQEPGTVPVPGPGGRSSPHREQASTGASGSEPSDQPGRDDKEHPPPVPGGGEDRPRDHQPSSHERPYERDAPSRDATRSSPPWDPLGRQPAGRHGLVCLLMLSRGLLARFRHREHLPVLFGARLLGRPYPRPHPQRARDPPWEHPNLRYC